MESQTLFSNHISRYREIVYAILFRSTAILTPQAILRAEHRWHWQHSLLGWLLSLVLHAMAVIVLGYFFSLSVPGINRSPFDTAVGGSGGAIFGHFSSGTVDNPYYDDEQPGDAQASRSKREADVSGHRKEQSATELALAMVAAGPPPVDIGATLPGREPDVGVFGGLASVIAGGDGSTAHGGESTAGSGGGILGRRHRPGGRHGTFARTNVYGAQAEGTSFVYVFDRSSSMSSSAYDLLASAKRELLASLDDLGDEHCFQIIFYNERPACMDLGRAFAGLVFADRKTKELARRFVEGIDAAGGTRHFEALKEALQLQPDFIFFLTDADEPGLSDGQLSHIRHLNGGNTTINTIEFGDSVYPNRDNFLARLARENGGEYVYIDVTRR